MPLYLCNSVAGSIPEAARAGIASDVTDIHCEVTGAPRDFVHVFFFEDAPRQPLHGRSVFLFGSIRAGRTPEQKRAIVERTRQSISRYTGLPASKILVDTTDVPAGWVMEGGSMLPEPGEEEAWLKSHARAR